MNYSWGQDNNGIWVDHGCRAEFYIEQVNRPIYRDRPRHGQRDYDDELTEYTVRCESVKRRRSFCEIDTYGEVELYKQLSKSDCVYRSSWGYTRKGIWVDRGCRAEFVVSEQSYSSGGNFGETIVCESIDNRREYCRVKTRRGVRIERELSKSPCVRYETWDYDRNGIWVDEGCRAEFRLGR